MSRTSVIAWNSFKESIRDRILYGLFLFAVLIIGLSRAMGGLSFAEQERIVTDFGLAGVQISVAILSIFVGSTLVSKELDKKTILTLLVRPLSRAEFLMGKYFGFLMVVFSLATGLCLVLFLVLTFMDIPILLVHFISLHGIILESMVLISLTVMFGCMSKPFLTVCMVSGVFIIGHWQENLRYFADQSRSDVLKVISSLASYLIPNLETYNWKSQAANKELISLGEFLLANINAFAWSGCFLALAVLIFWRKDCV